LIIQADTELAGGVEELLRRRRIFHERRSWKQFVVFSGLDSSQLHRGMGMPATLGRADWQALPEPLDGFN
jgi:hypothetical protein